MNKGSRFRVVVCASGGGGNFQALIDASNDLGIEITRLIVDRQCGAIERAVRNGIEYVIFAHAQDKKRFETGFHGVIPTETDLIVLAGFMPTIPHSLCEKWRGKIINTHPSLLPKYGGLGMYGVRVQKAVMEAKELQAGCTVHFVNEVIDGGAILLQKAIDVNYSESPWELGGRVFKEENKLLVEAVRLIRAKVQSI